MRAFFLSFLVAAFFVALMPGVSDAALKARYVPIKTAPTDMDLVEVGVVKEVLKSNSIQLENGSVFILDNMRTPVYYEKPAREYLAELVKGKTVGLYANKTLSLEGQADEHGNERVHAVVDDGTWVEGAMVSKGLAWVDSTPSNRDCVEPLYKREIPARASKVGFWASPEYQVKNADNVGNAVGSFIVFEGVPTIIKLDYTWDLLWYWTGHHSRSMVLSIKRDDYYLFPSYAADPTRHGFSAADFTGIRMRVRGWVEPGPSGVQMIRITHPEQVEFPNGPPVIK